MSQHAPGSLRANLLCRADQGPYLQATIQHSTGNFVASMYGGRPDTAWDADTVNATTLLFAAAPDLLNVAKAVMEWASTPGEHGGNPYLKPFVQLAEAAIAKAEGVEGPDGENMVTP